MRMRHAAAVAGLALGLMSGAAKAGTVEYNIFVPFTDGNAITGTIDTNIQTGPLSASNIVNYDLFFGGAELNPSDSQVYLQGTSLVASGNSLTYSFDSANGEYFAILQNDGNGLAEVNFASGDSTDQPFYAAQNSDQSIESNQSVVPGTVLTIGVTEGTVSAVPLPASAPMFGAALLALGAVGYGVKRKKSAAKA